MKIQNVGIDASSTKVKNRTVVILILGILSAIIPLSIDMYLPGFPVIAGYFSTSVDKVSYSLASFFIGICLGQLIAGPLIDRFGRKKPLYFGLAGFLLATIGCSVAPSMDMLIALRFIQAIGGCVTMVAPRAIVRDIFPLDENAKIFSVLILVLSVSPLLAPTIGTIIITSMGWKFIFIFLAIIVSLVFIAIILWLPESKKADTSVLIQPKFILEKYRDVLKNPTFYTYAISGAISFAGLFAYLSGSPFVFMRIYNVSQQQYGIIFAVIAIGLTVSSQLNSILLRRYQSEQIMRFFIYVQAALGLLLFTGTMTGMMDLYSTITLIFLFLSCQGFCFPNSSALAMAPFTKEAGSASALLGALQMGFGALAAGLVGFLSPTSAAPMAAVMFGFTLVSLAIILIGSKANFYKSPQPVLS